MCRDKRDYDRYGWERGRSDGGRGGCERNWEGHDFWDEQRPFGFYRRFVSRREKVRELEDYYRALISEAEGVLEAIEELREEIEMEDKLNALEKALEEEKEKKPRKRRGRKPKKEAAEEKTAG